MTDSVSAAPNLASSTKFVPLFRDASRNTSGVNAANNTGHPASTTDFGASRAVLKLPNSRSIAKSDLAISTSSTKKSRTTTVEETVYVRPEPPRALRSSNDTISRSETKGSVEAGAASRHEDIATTMITMTLTVASICES